MSQSKKVILLGLSSHNTCSIHSVRIAICLSEISSCFPDDEVGEEGEDNVKAGDENVNELGEEGDEEDDEDDEEDEEDEDGLGGFFVEVGLN